MTGAHRLNILFDFERYVPARLLKNTAVRWRLKQLAGFRHQLFWGLMRDRKDIDGFGLFERSVFSQNGEDGIIRLIFHKIGVTNRFFVEFGVESGRECNTRYLREVDGWDGLMMDAADNNPPYIKKEFITAENINGLFAKYKVPREFDLLSIDIDTNDYWIWKAIEGFSPRVVIMEYNSSIPTDQCKSTEYNSSACWDGTNYFGASLLALTRLGERKGYTLIACDSRGINAFFVRTDLVKNHFRKRPMTEIFKPPRYGNIENGRFTGHPKSKRRMRDVV